MNHWNFQLLVKVVLSLGIAGSTMANIIYPEWGVSIALFACAINQLWIWQP